MPVLVVAAVVLGTWYLSRRRQASKEPVAAQRMAGVLRSVWKGFLALVVVGVLAAMARGCDGRGSSGEDGPRVQPCPAFHEEDCPPAPPSGP